MQHFNGHNVFISVFRGMCEKINNHSHPSFLFFYINRDTNEFSVYVEILDTDHSHVIELTEKEIEAFMNEGMLLIKSSTEEGHCHSFLFTQEEFQDEIIDPFNPI